VPPAKVLFLSVVLSDSGVLTPHSEQEAGGKPSTSGANNERRTSSASKDSRDSLEHRTRGLDIQGSSSIPNLGPGSQSMSSNAPMTPSNMTNPSNFPSVNSPGSTASNRSPHAPTESYRPPSSGHQTYGNDEYTVAPSLSQSPQTNMFLPQHSSALDVPAFTAVEYTPRTTAASFPHFLLPSLQIPDNGPPGLGPHEASAWPSSASDSINSTPSDNSRHRLWPAPPRSGSVDWQQPGQQHLSAFSMTPRDLYSPVGLDPATSQAGLVYTGFTQAPMPTGHPIYSGPLDMPMTAGFPDDTLLDPHQTHFHPSNTVRSLTPPPTSAQSSETLVTPSPALPSERMMNSLALGRQKEVAVGLLATPALMSGSLSRAVRNAIPAYLDVYFARFQHLFPMIHRPSFEATGEQAEVLRCAMAAMGTQYLDGKDDRIRGNQLHEWAWQQTRYVGSFSFPCMDTRPRKVAN
jgi:hypothetical protein